MPKKPRIINHSERLFEIKKSVTKRQLQNEFLMKPSKTNMQEQTISDERLRLMKKEVLTKHKHYSSEAAAERICYRSGMQSTNQKEK